MMECTNTLWSEWSMAVVAVLSSGSSRALQTCILMARARIWREKGQGITNNHIAKGGIGLSGTRVL